MTVMFNLLNVDNIYQVINLNVYTYNFKKFKVKIFFYLILFDFKKTFLL